MYEHVALVASGTGITFTMPVLLDLAQKQWSEFSVQIDGAFVAKNGTALKANVAYIRRVLQSQLLFHFKLNEIHLLNLEVAASTAYSRFSHSVTVFEIPVAV
ncbi:hypothetical protein WG66_005951 [Moniliophthora roreri]|nr:hypothetical protein WG66_005951 [Moniliophthora roreri]